MVRVLRGADEVGTGTTDGDGRIAALADLAPGSYHLAFEIGPYFRGDCFFNQVTLDVELGDAGHYHVPLLVSRYGITSYRGS